jgi:disulfide bond formation protein DsbB
VNSTIQSGNLELYEGLVLGVGEGTIAVCIMGIVGLFICFFKDCSPTPSLMVAVAILLPVITLLIILAIPKKSLSTDTEKEDLLPTDAFRVRTGIFSALIFIVCVLVSFLMCIGKMTTLTGTRMDSD